MTEKSDTPEAMRPVPQNAPVLRAWNIYKQSADYANTRKWAKHDEHVDGSLWAAFYAGYFACAVAESAQPPVAGEVDSHLKHIERVVVAYGMTAQHAESLAVVRTGIESLSAQVEALKQEADEDNDLIDRLSKLLAETSIALKGPELPLHRHSYHDVPKVAAEIALACRIGDELLRQEREKVAAAEQRADRLRAELSTLTVEQDALFDVLHWLEGADYEIPAGITRWWQRATERREAARAKESGNG